MNKRQVATLLKRMPWTGAVAHAVYRVVWQPWVTSGVVGAVFNDQQQVLIVEHVLHPKFPWGLPGGWMGRNEDPQETVRRELLEETSLQIEVLRLLAVESATHIRNHLDIAYLCLAPQPEPIRLSSELLDYRWVDLAEISHIPMTRFHHRVVQAARKEITTALSVKLTQEA